MKIEFPKPRMFYFHYNKPATLRAGKVQMSVHVDGKCIIGEAVRCGVGCYSHENKRQPRLVMKGLCRSVEVSEGEIFIM